MAFQRDGRIVFWNKDPSKPTPRLVPQREIPGKPKIDSFQEQIWNIGKVNQDNEAKFHAILDLNYLFSCIRFTKMSERQINIEIFEQAFNFDK